MLIRIIYFTILFFSLSSAIELRHELGFKFAVTRSTVSKSGSNSPNISRQYRTGFNFAACLEINHSQYFHILTHIEYSQKGYYLVYEDDLSTNNNFEILKPDARFDYISIPIFIKFLLPGKDISSSISFGIRADHMIDEYRAKIKTPDSSIDYYESPDLRENNLGSSIMLGLDFRNLCPCIISFEFRYNFDFGSITLHNDELRTGPTKNNSFDFWVGFRL